MSKREPPTEEWLALSRARCNVPDDWVWHYCSAPDCEMLCWLPPEAESLCKSRGAMFVPVCDRPGCPEKAIAYLAARVGATPRRLQ